MGPALYQKFRTKDNQTLPGYYHWVAHLIFNFGFILGLIVFGFTRWTSATPIKVLGGLPLLVLLWGVVEYLIHRHILHGSLPFFRKVSKEHSYNHHRYFTNQHMYAEQCIDVSRVFLLSDHLLGLIAFNIILSLGVGVVYPEIGWMLFLAGVFYVLIYEVVHGLCHFRWQPSISWGQRLLQHHRDHHDLSQMSRANFSVVFPILDKILGSEIQEKSTNSSSKRRVQLIYPGTSEAQAYEQLLQKKFLALKDNRNPIDIHIVLMEGDVFLAGASLVQFQKLSQDPDLLENWSVLRDAQSTRILRLWSTRQALVPRLLAAILNHISAEDFVYGVLSVSLKFARENSYLFQKHEDVLRPHQQLDECDWPELDFSTSEGQRLISIYQKFNARFLGPVAGNENEKTLRVVMGIHPSEMNSPQFLSRYEEIH